MIGFREKHKSALYDIVQHMDRNGQAIMRCLRLIRNI